MIARATIYLAVCLALVSGINARQARRYRKAEAGYRNNKQYKFSNATTDLTLDLLKELSKRPGNVVFSPTSIGILLSMLQQGASGKTRTELSDVLHSSPEETEQGYRGFVHSSATQERTGEDGTISEVANRIYVNPSFAVREKFKTRVQANYATKIVPLQSDSTKAAADINQWVKEATHGHITDIMSPDSLDANTALVMASAMFFNGKWEKKFADVRPGTFRLTASENVEVPFLVTQETLTAGRENDYKWIELPYKGGKYSMYLIRSTPRQSLQDMLENINADALRVIFKSKTKKNVALRMPAFKIQHKPAIKDALIALGLRTVFTPDANLSRISEQLSVSHMAHEAYLDVNEEGTEAAAATVAVIHTLSANWDPDDMDFRLDEPFFAFVVDKVRGFPIMAARIADPRK